MPAQSIRRRSYAVGLALTLVGALVGGSTALAVAAPTEPDPAATSAAPTTTVEPAADPAADPTEPAAEESPEAPTAEVTTDATAPAAEPQADAPATEPAAPAADPAAAAPQAGAVPAAAGTVSSATLNVLADGTPNVDGGWDPDDTAGNDSGPTNGIVRTQDTVLYQWTYTVTTPGDVTVVQTLPDELVWVVAESTASCAEGTAAVSADRHKLTCTLTDQPTGGQQYRVRAQVRSGANAQTVTSTLTSGAASASAPVTISARPSVSLTTKVDSSFGAVVKDGEVGRLAKFMIALYSPIDANRGLKGTEALADGFTMTLDTSGMGEDALLYQACSASLGSFGAALGDVAGAGSWSCTQDTAAQTITLRATGVISDLRKYPALTPIRALITGVEVPMWIPSSSYTAGQTLSLQVEGFDPVSVGGQPNWGGTLAAPGQAPGAALVPHLNGETFTFNTKEQLRSALGSVYATDGSGSFGATPPFGSTGPAKGDSPMVSGETFSYGGYLRNDSPTLTDYTDATVCTTWDQSLLTIAGPPVRGTQNLSAVGEITGIEYASLPLTTDAQRRGADCGTSGDGNAAWSSDLADVGGAAQVNAVRFVIPSLPAGDPTSPYIGVPMTRTDAPLAVGTPLATFWQVDSDQTDLERSTFNPGSMATAPLGGRARAVDAVIRVVGDPGATSFPGEQRTLTYQPVVTSSSGTVPGPQHAQDVSLAITIPAGLTVVPNSWLPTPAPVITDNPDGSRVYTFALGDLSSDEEIPAVSLDVRVDVDVHVPTTLTPTAAISTPSDIAGRSAATPLGINALAVLSATMGVDDAAIVPDVARTYQVRIANGLPDVAGPGAVVAVLPFEGDGRGTHGIGVLDLTALSVVRGDVTVQYTTDAAADVMGVTETDLAADAGVAWQVWPSDGSVPAGVTALRFVLTALQPGEDIVVDLTVQTDRVDFGGQAISDLSGLVESAGGEIHLEHVSRTELNSGTCLVDGTVYLDEDASGALDGTDTGIAGAPVLVTGHAVGANGVDDGGSGDDLLVTAADPIVATSAADGTYQVDGLAPGTWTLAGDLSSPALAGLAPAEVPAPLTLTLASTATEVDLGFVEVLVAPVVVDDTAQVEEGSTTSLPVLDNDTVEAGTVISAVTQPAAGTVEIDADGRSVTYTAPAGFSGPVEFTYTITDPHGQTATATVSVTVLPEPGLPALTGGTIGVDIEGPTRTVVDVLSVVEGSKPTVTQVVDGAAHGTVELVDGQVVYTPDDGWTGLDTFTVEVTDEFGQTAIVTVNATTYASDVLGTEPPAGGTDGTGSGPDGSGTGTDGTGSTAGSTTGSTGGSRLAITGSELTGLAGLALGLLAGGGWLMLIRRRGTGTEDSEG